MLILKWLSINKTEIIFTTETLVKKNAPDTSKIQTKTLEITRIDEINQRVWKDIGNNLNNELKESQKALKKATALDYQEGIAFSFLNQGYCQLHLGKNNVALQSFQKATDIYQTLGIRHGELRCQIAFGNLYLTLDILDKAFDYAQQVIKIAEEIEDLHSLSTGLSNLGEIFFRLQKFDDALKYYLKGLAIMEDTNINYPIVLGNIAKAYIELNEYDKPLEYLSKGIDITQKYDQKMNHTFLLSTLGQVHHHLKNYDQASKIYFKALDQAKSLTHNIYQIEILLNIGKHFYQTDDLEKSLLYLQEAQEICKVSNNTTYQSELYEMLYLVSKKEKKYKHSLSYLENLYQTNKKVFDQKLDDKISILSAGYEYKQLLQEKEIYRLEHIELKKKSDFLKQSNLTMSLLSNIGKKITSNLEIDVIMEEIYQGISSLMDTTIFGLTLLNKETQQIEYKYYKEEDKKIFPSNISLLDENSYFATCIYYKKEIRINDLNVSDKKSLIFTDLNNQQKIPKSLIFLPLFSEKEAIGGLTIQSYEKNRYTIQHIEMLRVLGSYIVSALENSLTHQEVSKLNRLLTRDKKELEEANKKIAHLANHDALTNLPNRRLFKELLTHVAYNCQRQNQSFAICYLDLDNFKPINDTLGHKFGDAVLIKFAERMQKLLRKNDIVARVGGDEFVVLLSNIKDTVDCEIVAEKIIEGTSKKIKIEQHTCQIGLSIGISIYPKDGDNAEELITNADKAMYRVKKGNKNAYQFYNNN